MTERLNTYGPMRDDKEIPCVDFHLPTSWGELNEVQLSYVLQLKASSTMIPIEVRLCAMYRFCGIEERAPRNDEEKDSINHGYHYFRHGKDDMMLPEWYLYQMCDAMRFLDHPDSNVTRLRKIVPGYRPVHADFSDLSFGDYLSVENLWQSIMAWSSVNSAEGSTAIAELIEKIARILYRPIYYIHFSIDMFDLDVHMPSRRPFYVSPLMQQNIMHWLTGWHAFAAVQWPNLFKSSGGGCAAITDQMLREQTDLQIQALTDGDVTKVQKVLDIDTFTALNMLDIKQRDAIAAKKAQEKREQELKLKRK